MAVTTCTPAAQALMREWAAECGFLDLITGRPYTMATKAPAAAFHRGATITSEDLRFLLACDGGVIKFRALWPRGTTLNLSNLRRAALHGMDLMWLMGEILHGEDWAKFSNEWDQTRGHLIELRNAISDDEDATRTHAKLDAMIKHLLAEVVWKHIPEPTPATVTKYIVRSGRHFILPGTGNAAFTESPSEDHAKAHAYGTREFALNVALRYAQKAMGADQTISVIPVEVDA